MMQGDSLRTLEVLLKRVAISFKSGLSIAVATSDICNPAIIPPEIGGAAQLLQFHFQL